MEFEPISRPMHVFAIFAPPRLPAEQHGLRPPYSSSPNTVTRSLGLSPSASRILRFVSIRQESPRSTRSIVNVETPARRASSAFDIIFSRRSFFRLFLRGLGFPPALPCCSRASLLISPLVAVC